MGKIAIGVDLGASNLRVAAIDGAGVITASSQDATPAEGPEAVVDLICRQIAALRDQIQARGDVLIGVGVGMPGIVLNGVVKNMANLANWKDFPIKLAIEKRIGTNVAVENDGNTAALGEKAWGLGRCVDSLCLLTLGTGVGAGIVLRGEVWAGAAGMAAEVGHMIVDPDGEQCGCGSRGCLETIASKNGILRMARRMASGSPALKGLIETKNLSVETIYQTASAGDPLAQEIFTRVGRALGRTLTNLITTLDLPLYVLAGGISATWDRFAPAMILELEACCCVYRVSPPDIRRSELPNPGILGAAGLVFSRMEEDRSGRKSHEPQTGLLSTIESSAKLT